MGAQRTAQTKKHETIKLSPIVASSSTALEGIHSFLLVAGCVGEPCNLVNKAMLPLVVHEDTAMACKWILPT